MSNALIWNLHIFLTQQKSSEGGSAVTEKALGAKIQRVSCERMPQQRPSQPELQATL